jgi:hypothetical protein
MIATTKTASRGRSAADAEGRPDPGDGAGAPTRPLPDVSEWMRTAFHPGLDATDLPGFALLRAVPMVGAAERALDGMAQMQAEMARFGAWRLHRALEAQADLLACRSRVELREAQRSYLEGLFEDYVREWSRLGGYALRVGTGQPLPPSRGPEGERHATAV